MTLSNNNSKQRQVNWRDIIPFEIHQSGENSIYVSSQQSTISQNLDLESYCRIANLDRAFIIKPNQVIYVSLTIDPSLSIVSGTGQLVCSYVGSDLMNSFMGAVRGEVNYPINEITNSQLITGVIDSYPNGVDSNGGEREWDYTTDGWLEYPSPYRIYPRDITGSNGQIVRRRRNKKQMKLFILVGYASEVNLEPWSTVLEKDLDKLKNPNITSGTFDMSTKYYITQSLKNNVLLMDVCVAGVPMVIGMPHLASPAPLYKFTGIL